MPKCADTDKQKISQYRWLLISEPIIGCNTNINDLYLRSCQSLYVGSVC